MQREINGQFTTFAKDRIYVEIDLDVTFGWTHIKKEREELKKNYRKRP